MKVRFYQSGTCVTVSPEGEIDECSVSSLRKEVDEFIDEHSAIEQVIFNLSAVRFMDSTGIGFLIGRYKKLNRYRIRMYISNPNTSADKVLSVSGIYNLIEKV